MSSFRLRPIPTLRRLEDHNVLTREVAALFHDLRKRGNDAAHKGTGTRRDSLDQLRMAQKLAGGINRLVLDVSSKPPSTIEWE